MLVLLVVDDPKDCFAAGVLRRELAKNIGPTVWLDAVSIADSLEQPVSDHSVLSLGRTAGAALDALEPASWQACIVSIPVSYESRARELAFWLRRKAFTKCFLLPVGAEQDTNWARRAAEEIRSERAPLLVPEPPPPPRIETARLVLTIPTEDQARGYFDTIIGSTMFDTLVWEGPKSPADLAEFAMLNTRDHARGSGAWMAYGIIERETNLWIGMIGAKPGDRDVARFTLGYNLAVSSQSRGYGTEAVAALVHYLFEEKLAARVDADVFVENEASRRVLEKLGFHCEGTLRSMYPKRGTRRDAWVFALTRDEWERGAGRP